MRLLEPATVFNSKMLYIWRFFFLNNLSCGVLVDTVDTQQKKTRKAISKLSYLAFERLETLSCYFPNISLPFSPAKYLL